MKDLLCLVADKDMEAAMAGLLGRPQALGIRRITCEVVVHPRRDPGVYRKGVEFVRSLATQYQHGLLLLDADWEGAPKDLQAELDRALAQVGLDNWGRAIVIVPELEVWVWSDSPHVDNALGWSGRQPSLRSWLEQHGLWSGGDRKPSEPKRAIERVLWEVRKPRSSAIYRSLAATVSLERCQDPAFGKLRDTLRKWFGETA